ncbi:MAG: hypothetical protein KBD21_02405 [Candidatus Pacebacteria bacterium]|nr:hypothetical protein [Candidatus Paceibacterota bacterium]
MDYRLNNNVLFWSALLLALAVAAFAYTYFGRTSSQPEQVVETPQEDETLKKVEVIDAKHHVGGDMHTIAGSVSVPSPCHSISVEPFMNDQSGEQVELRFTTVLGDGVCPQVVTDATFKVTFTAKPDARISATWNGTAATLNLVPVDSSESLDKEFYFKG